jgi:hypothetical protein
MLRNVCDFTLATLDVSATDVAQVLNIPAGTEVLDCYLNVLTAETADATCSLGYGSDVDYWGKTLNLDATGVVSTVLQASATWDAGSIADGNEEAKDVTVAGAAIGDVVEVIAGLDVADLAIVGSVTAEDTVTVQLLNNTGGAVDLASQSVSVNVKKGNKRGTPVYFSAADTIDLIGLGTNGDVNIDGLKVEVVALCTRRAGYSI